MNDQLQIALAEILSRATQGIDAGTQFLSAQMPDVIQQLLLWKLVSALMFTLFFSASACALFKVAIRIYISGKGEEKRIRETKTSRISYIGEYDWFLPGMSILLLSTGAGLLLIGGFAKGMAAVQIWLAPKIYLIEYAASLAK